MTLSNLHQNIFIIPVGHYFDSAKNDLYLVYAPLSGNMMLADEPTVQKMKQTGEDPEMKELMQTLTDATETVETIENLEDYRVLYVLPNYTCNFSCSYCYSAKGRSDKRLSPHHLKAVLDYFVDARRSDGQPLKISFVGGGEPMISWDLVKYGLEYASSLAQKQGIEIFFGLITNGSIINDEMLDTLSYYRVVPRISFEILEEIQNKQRGHYSEVCNVIDRMLNAGIHCELRSMITPDNVHLMEEMTLEMITRFPAIDHYYFDPITDAKIFHDVEFTRIFFRNYRHFFMKARRRAEKNDKDLRNAVSRSLETIVERYCNGEFCLTPEGTISICLEVSSPKEKEYEKHIYGYVDENNTLQIDRKKFQYLKEKEMAVHRPKCKSCFVKWNCGGGCMANNNQYAEEILDMICDSTRELSVELLLEKLIENAADYPHLFKKSIFTIPLDDGQSENRYLVYAPLYDFVTISDEEYLTKLENGDPDVTELSDRLQNIEKYGKKMYSVKKPDDYLLLYVIPAYKCNFSCTYCFSAKGRSDRELDKNQLKNALDFFVDSSRTQEKKLLITFLGGGEPMISWKTVKYGIEYAYSLAKIHHFQLIMEIVTNGSIMNEDILQTLVRYNVRVRVSFEVLEDIQNIQRGHYNKVCKTITQLAEANLYLEIRSMITPLNVERMEEMVTELTHRFPQINNYLFDPITDKNTFNDVAKTRTFCEKYQHHFFKALDIALHHGKKLTCAPLRNINSLVERYCYGELCLTPEGTITVCHRISSPLDDHYQHCIYGKINEANQVEFNLEKYRQLIHSDTIYENMCCSRCFMKWNCGGGCMVHNKEYSPEIRRVFCDFTRSFSKELLLRRLRDESNKNQI